ncbi:MAG: AraC family transcriptional regulator [Lachnospiraceae bacterium]|nr:AraC family transcriptional regulator [Lachnospiraceae bacterium]
MKEKLHLNNTAGKDEQEKIIRRIDKLYNEKRSTESEFAVTGSWYDKEQHLLDALAFEKGDITEFYQDSRIGFFIDDELLKARYLLVMVASIVSRGAIVHGLPESEAFALSDAYIEESARVKSAKEVNLMTTTIPVDYAKRIRAQSRKTGNRYVRICKDYISENICENISVEDLSSECGISGEYLCRIFKKNTGKTLHAYIREQKLERAAYLIKHSTLSIKEIAWQLGYTNCGYFSGQFRIQYHCTPIEYRLRE